MSNDARHVIFQQIWHRLWQLSFVVKAWNEISGLRELQEDARRSAAVAELLLPRAWSESVEIDATSFRVRRRIQEVAASVNVRIGRVVSYK